MSPASSLGSQADDEDEGEELILRAPKPLMPLAEQEEPVWEMVVPSTAVAATAKPSQDSTNRPCKTNPPHPNQPIIKADPSSDTNTAPSPLPQIAIARSVSVTKRPGQLLVRRGTKVERDQLDILEVDERLVERQPHTPTVIERHLGHRPKKSENIVIESV